MLSDGFALLMNSYLDLLNEYCTFNFMLAGFQSVSDHVWGVICAGLFAL